MRGPGNLLDLIIGKVIFFRNIDCKTKRFLHEEFYLIKFFLVIF